MNNTQKQLHGLFEAWEKCMSEKGFSKDGVHYKHLDKQERYNKWDKAEKKVLFIVKEPRDNSGDIAEDWSSRISYRVDGWYTKTQYVYLMHICDNNPEFKDIIIDDDIIKEKLETRPFCWINVKKSVGKATANSKEIAKHLETYGNLLLKQIEILKPTDIVCLCGGNDWALKEKLKSLTYKPNIYRAYHPAYRRNLETKYRSLKPL